MRLVRALTDLNSFPVGWFVIVVATSSALAIYLAVAGASLALAMAPVVVGTGVMFVLGCRVGMKRRAR
jgi:hypothetical protein